jgi:hypothetical protein
LIFQWILLVDVALVWLGPAIAQALVPINARFDQLDAKIFNGHAIYANSPLRPLPDNAGIISQDSFVAGEPDNGSRLTFS